MVCYTLKSILSCADLKDNGGIGKHAALALKLYVLAVTHSLTVQVYMHTTYSSAFLCSDLLKVMRVKLY